MATTSFFIFSEDSSTEGSPGKLHLTNPIQVLKLKYIPSFYSLCATFGISEIDQSKDEKLIISLYNPDEEKIDGSSFYLKDITYNNSEQEDPDSDMLDLNLDLRNVEFEKAGKYRMELYIDDTFLSKHYLEVLKGK